MGEKDKSIRKKQPKNKDISKEQTIEEVTLKKEEKKAKIVKIIDKISLIGSIVIIVIMVLLLCFNVYKNNKEKPAQYNDDMEIEEYNSRFEKYEGLNVKGSDVKKLIAEIIDNNYKYVGQKGKFVSIDIDDMRHFENNYLVSACTMSRLDNNQDNVKYAADQMNYFITTFDDSKMFNIFIEKTDNRVTDIEILEIQN